MEEQNNKLKQKLLATFQAFDAFCKQHQIQYFAAYGTLIGAVRHKGLIPWDDDIDVVMLKNDYDKFLSLQKESELMGYEIRDFHDGVHYPPFAKFMDMNTTIWEQEENEVVLGVYIDVFPLYAASEKVEENTKRVKLYKGYYELCCSGVWKHSVGNLLRLIMGFHLIGAFYWFKGCFFDRFRVAKNRSKFFSLDEKLSTLIDSKYLINYYAVYGAEKEMCQKKWFDSVIELPYEKFQIPAPVGYDAYLKQLYGDYMTPPPKEKQVSHHYRYYVDYDKRLSLEEIKKLKTNK